jgi:hypothetical protein
MKNAFGLMALVGVAMFFVFGTIIFGYALQESDYEASNSTGNNTPYTNQTVNVFSISTAWFGGIAILLLILVVGLVFWSFWR